MPELLLKKGYVVDGMQRRSSWFNTRRVRVLVSGPARAKVSFALNYGYLTDKTNLIRIVQEQIMGCYQEGPC